MTCYLCDNDSFIQIRERVRDNNKIKVIQCQICGLVTLDTFTHISKNHYEDGKMHAHQNTIDEWLLETEPDDNKRYEMFKSKILEKKVLDFGCGNANFLLKSKKIASLVQGVEIEKRIQEYYKQTELKIWHSLDDLSSNSTEKFDLITAFHVFEHLENPLSVLKSLSSLLNNHGEIIIEVPNSDDALLTLYKNKEFARFTYWSQHLFLFNQYTFTELVKKSGLNLNWVKQIQRYGLSNHLYWLSNGLPGGQKIFNFINSENLDELYAQQLASLGKCDTIIFSISLPNQ
jgi:2-polyprenyl-3-methyl-5-hydroxy-6-metoxy-1,4-benzoquinol methylase